MKLLISLLLCPTVFGQIQQKSKDPNDEPFLPIFPVYPYSPKLMKRGVDREAETRLTAELYGPKVDGRESYSTSYTGGNYPRDPYYPSYDPYPKSSLSSPSTPSPSSSSYTSYYPTNHHATSGSYSTMLPYNLYDTYANPYASSSMRSSMTSNAYTPSSYSSPSYLSSSYSTIYPPSPYNGASYSAPPYVPLSNYYYQHPYYYPAYYSPPLYPPPPPPPLQPSDYNKDTTDSDSKENDEKNSDKGQKSKDDDKSTDLVNDNQFVDGGNYISPSTRDLESQSSSYKLDNPYNDPSSDSRQSPLSQGTYKLVSAAGQRDDADYSIAATYAKTQQLEQLMRQTLAKLLAQNAARQVVRYPTYENKRSPVIKSSDVFYANPNNYDGKQAFIVSPNTLAKTGLRYLIDPTGLTNVATNVHSESLLSRQVLQTPAALTRTTKYPDDQYLRKPVTRLNLQQSQGLFVTPSKTVKLPATSQSTSGYEVYDESDSSQANQSYADSLDNNEEKQEQSYENQQDQGGYKNPNFVTAQTPQVYSYRYTSLRPLQTANQQDSQEYEENPSDANFGAKQSNKS